MVPVWSGPLKGLELYALILPNDPMSGDYLHKAGETARSIRSFDKALGFYDWITTKYPDHPNQEATEDPARGPAAPRPPSSARLSAACP